MRARKLKIVLAASLAVFLAFYFVFSRLEKDTFPEISETAYAGTISGLLASPNEESTFYVERLDNLPVLLVYIFIEGFEPKLLPLTASPSGAFKKLELELNGKQYYLSGSGQSGKMHGELFLGEKKVGSWELAKIEESIRSELAKKDKESTLSRLVMSHARHESLKSEFDSASAAYKEKSKEFIKLQALMNDREALLSFAKEKKLAIDEELRLALREREDVNQQVERELENLLYARRTKKLGQAILRARKIARREGAWYLASLPEDGAEALLEPALELDLGKQKVDQPQAEVDPKLIQEYRRLEEEVARERRAIGVLERRLLEKNSAPGEKKRKKSRWWKFWE